MKKIKLHHIEEKKTACSICGLDIVGAQGATGTYYVEGTLTEYYRALREHINFIKCERGTA